MTSRAIHQIRLGADEQLWTTGQIEDNTNNQTHNSSVNIPPWRRCTWAGNINKDTDEEERKHRRVLAASDTHTALSPDTPRRVVSRGLTRDNFRAVMTPTRADIGQDIIVGHHTDDHG